MSDAYNRPRYLGNPKFRFRQRQKHGSERPLNIIWWIACAVITALVVFHFAVSVNKLIGVHQRNLQHILSPPHEETSFDDSPRAENVITAPSSTNPDASSSISVSSRQQHHTFIQHPDPVRPSARAAEIPAKLVANRTCDFRIDQYRAQGLPQSRIESQKKIIEGRLREKETWFDKSCSRWGLSGEWKDRGRKIYYSIMVAAELQLLLVLLEEIYPVVDVLIFQEAKHTWRMGYMEEKEMFFAKYNFSHFQKYAPKIRYFDYDFDWIEECQPKNGVPEFPTPRCKWLQQWHARNQLARGATDIEDHDIFVVADLDEMISREFLLATKHCIVHEEMEQPGGKCTKVTVRTFGHKYNFECTAMNPAGHFHPDLTTGRCMRDLGPEEVRMYYGSEWNNQNK
ncbi:hypothetical protein CYMTET_35108 [Cymbomonas tetramitiformis]|uniref:Uncharacterized protein n=1 Tax=Cymbomonas tetramitiformis TaxID=36881 RepID=A0AAE0F9U6_9CHLO|nr:hypothetical protein CYMTET_35108 [Cymbomonas tetramitiformis]